MINTLELAKEAIERGPLQVAENKFIYAAYIQEANKSVLAWQSAEIADFQPDKIVYFKSIIEHFCRGWIAYE